MSVLVLICAFGCLSAQINIKIGYKIGYGDFDLNNMLLSGYVPSNGEIKDAFASVHVIHGIELGLRYKTGSLEWEVGWESSGRDSKALIFMPVTDNFTSRKYSYSLGGLYAGVVNNYGKIGLGASVHRRRLGIKRQIDSDNNLDLVNESLTSLQLYLTWVVQQSERVSFVIKPYYQFSLGSYDFENLALDLNIPDNGSGFNDSVDIFGLSFIFYNGKQ